MSQTFARGIICAVAVVSLQAQGGPVSDQRTERLAGVARLWATVKYFHPLLAYSSPALWDEALLRAIRETRGASDDVQYASAISSMLSALNDPVTRTIGVTKTLPSAPLRAPRQWLTADGYLVLSTGDYTEPPAIPVLQEVVTAAVNNLSSAQAVIIDLRSNAPLNSMWSGLTSIAFSANRFGARLFPSQGIAPGHRSRAPMLLDFVSERLVANGERNFQVTPGRVIAPAGTQQKPIVFLVNSNSDLPLEMFALQDMGMARVVAEPDTTEASRVLTTVLELAGGIRARVRLGELISPDGPRRFAADVQMESAPYDEQGIVEVARRALNVARVPDAPAVPAVGITWPETTATPVPYPPVEARIGAVVRLWAVFGHLAPYKPYARDWDDSLETFIGRVERANDALEYHLAIAEMLTRTRDSHGQIQSAVLRDHFGAAAPPIRVRMVEGVPVIAGFRDDAAARAAGADVGQEILAVDGERASDRLSRYQRFVAGSTPQAIAREAAERLFPQATTGGFTYGPTDSLALLTVRTAAGATRQLRLTRTAAFAQFRAQRSSEVIALLPGNVGYIDLDRLAPASIPTAFSRLRTARAIIFDLRGYPVGNLTEALITELTDRKEVVTNTAFAVATVPATTGNRHTLSHLKVERVTHFSGGDNPYRGRTLALIDERTQSAAEGIGLALRALSAKLIGTPTAGANGNIVNIPLAGGITVAFSALGIQLPDGGPLQGVGLLPDIVAPTTLIGLRAGRDEALEVALLEARR